MPEGGPEAPETGGGCLGYTAAERLRMRPLRRHGRGAGGERRPNQVASEPGGVRSGGVRVDRRVLPRLERLGGTCGAVGTRAVRAAGSAHTRARSVALDAVAAHGPRGVDVLQADRVGVTVEQVLGDGTFRVEAAQLAKVLDGLAVLLVLRPHLVLDLLPRARGALAYLAYVLAQPCPGLRQTFRTQDEQCWHEENEDLAPANVHEHLGILRLFGRSRPDY